jgi:LysR family transcriptional regulator, glycine cleavage system transcriptional activator
MKGSMDYDPNRLPSTTALRVFLSTARHLSMSRAAADLNLSQSAISQQVKALEQTLGVDLFKRVGRRLILTEPGQIYVVHAGQVLERLASASEIMRGFHYCGNLTISVCGPFAHRWLMPRLGSFRQHYPEVSLRFIASDDPVEFGTQDIDIAIRYGSPKWPGMRAAPFLKETVFPVCTPALKRKIGSLADVDAIRRLPLLIDGSARNAVTWDIWFHHVGIKASKAMNGVVFQDAALLLQAAAAGHGVALARGALVADDLATGLFVPLFDQQVEIAQRYCLIEPATTANRTKPDLFKQWLCDEAAAQVAADRYNAVALPDAMPAIKPAYDRVVPPSQSARL